MTAEQFLDDYLLNGATYSKHNAEKAEIVRQVTLKLKLHAEGVLPSHDPVNIGGVLYSKSDTSEYTPIFDRVAFSRFGNQNTGRIAWAKCNYIPVSKPYISRALNKFIGIIFTKNGYKLGSQHEQTQAYLHSNNFAGVPFEAYAKEHVLNRSITDPNGYFVVLRTDDLSGSEPSQPSVFFFGSHSVVHFHTEEEPFLCVRDAATNSITGRTIVCDKHNTNFVYTNKETGEVVIKKYSNYGILPYSIAAGKAVVKTGAGGDIVYQNSFIDYVLPVLDELLREFVHYTNNRKDSIATRAITKETCHTCNGTGKIKGDCGEGGSNYGNPNCSSTCDRCGGHGSTTSISQGDTIVIDREWLANNNGVSDFVNWFNPDTKIVDQDKSILHDTEKKIMELLSIRSTDSSEKESGEAKRLNQVNDALSIESMSNGVFTVIKILLTSIAAHIQNSGSPYVLFTTNRTVLTRTEDDYYYEISEYTKNGNLRYADMLQRDMLVSQGDYISARVIDFLLLYSNMRYMSDIQKISFEAAFAGKGILKQEQLLLYFGESEIRKYAHEVGDAVFLKTPLNIIFNQLLERLPAYE